MNLVNSKEVSFYNSLIQDYISGDLKGKGIINWDYSNGQVLQNLKDRNFSDIQREVLVNSLKNQYKGIALTKAEESNINSLTDSNTYTITTGHQLTLLGGPMFFYTKILNVIQLCEELTSKSTSTVIPVFWLASEDHDYEEICSVNLFGKKLICDGENKGPVGRIDSTYFTEFLEEVNQVLGVGERFQKVKEIINTAFTQEKNLAGITRSLVRALFAEDGLLIIDGDDADFKQQMIPYFLKEIESNTGYTEIQNQISALEGYKIQVNPREINLFYIEDEIRERIVFEGGNLTTVNQRFNIPKEEIQGWVAENAYKISPNAVLRPLYQEVLLPNVAYVGGPGEIAYWLELAPMFKAFKVDFPLPIVRTSYFLVQGKESVWLKENNIDFPSLMGNRDQLLNQFIKSISTNEISFEAEKETLATLYKDLLAKSKQIDSNLEKVVLGEEKRALSSLQNVEKRFNNAEKKKYEQSIRKLNKVIDKLLPNGTPMERVGSFWPYIANNTKIQKPNNFYSGDLIFVED